MKIADALDANGIRWKNIWTCLLILLFTMLWGANVIYFAEVYLLLSVYFFHSLDMQSNLQKPDFKENIIRTSIIPADIKSNIIETTFQQTSAPSTSPTTTTVTTSPIITTLTTSPIIYAKDTLPIFLLPSYPTGGNEFIKDFFYDATGNFYGTVYGNAGSGNPGIDIAKGVKFWPTNPKNDDENFNTKIEDFQGPTLFKTHFPYYHMSGPWDVPAVSDETRWPCMKKSQKKENKKLARFSKVDDFEECRKKIYLKLCKEKKFDDKKIQKFIDFHEYWWNYAAEFKIPHLNFTYEDAAVNTKSTFQKMFDFMGVAIDQNRFAESLEIQSKHAPLQSNKLKICDEEGIDSGPVTDYIWERTKEIANKLGYTESIYVNPSNSNSKS